MSAPDGDGCVTMSPDYRMELFLDIAAHNTEDGARLHLWENNGETSENLDNQKWKFVQIEPGFFLIQSKESSHLVLDVAGFSKFQSDIVHMWTEHRESNQLWRIVPTGRILFPMMREIEMSKFEMNIDEVEEMVRDVLDEFGFCVVRNILTEEELVEAECDWGKDLIDILDLDKHRTDPNASVQLQSGEMNVATVCDRLTSANLYDVPKIWPGKPEFLYNSHSLAQGRGIDGMCLHISL